MHSERARKYVHTHTVVAAANKEGRGGGGSTVYCDGLPIRKSRREDALEEKHTSFRCSKVTMRE